MERVDVAQPGGGNGLPTWWPMVVSGWGMAAATFSTMLHLSEALYPILGMAIMTGPTAAAVRRLKGGDDE